MRPVECKTCGTKPERIAKRGGSRGLACPSCGREYSHPEFTWEQIERVWNYANGDREDDEE